MTIKLSDKLLADQFRKDPRVRQAKNLLLQALQDAQKGITGVKAPQSDLQQTYREIIEEFNKIRGGKLYYPYLGSGFGKGVFVELLDGSIKYDMINGIGVHYWGHSHPEILANSIDASLNDTVMQGHLQQNYNAANISKILIEASGLDHCFLSSSGAMANENALKIIFQKKFPAHRILAFEKCFIGRSLALSQITDKPSFREGLPSNVFVDYIPFYDPAHPTESTQQAIDALKDCIERHPKEYAVFCFELIQGEGGFHAGTHEFFTALMQIARDHGIAVFIDEVQTFGRTSELFAFQHFKLQDFADVVTLGKLSHVCATLFKNEYKPKPGLLSQTFTSSTSALQVGQFIIEQLIHGDYFGHKGKINTVHAKFEMRFRQLEKKHPELIAGPYGTGSMIVFTPLKGNHDKVLKFVQDLFEAGVISFVAGSEPTRVRFLVPIGTIEDHDIEAVMDILEQVLTKDKK